MVMKVTQATRRYSLLALSVIFGIISVVGYYEGYGVPLLRIAARGEDCQKLCQDRCRVSTGDKDAHNGALDGLDLVPLNALKRSSVRDASRYSGLGHLDKVSLDRFWDCPTSKQKSQPKKRKDCYKERTFQSSKSPLIALVSFQGSGNTWLRYLLEQSTGIYTGSIYCDTELKKYFPGEYIVSGNVVAVKTHIPDSHHVPTPLKASLHRKVYDRAILLVRNPFDALVSEANRRWSSKKNNHLGLATEATFIGNSKWDWFVESKSVSWGLMLQVWLSQTDTPVLVVKYEQLLANLTGEMRRILDFIGQPVSQKRLLCVSQQEGYFKRDKHLNFDPYSTENKEAVNRIIQQVRTLAKKHGIHYDTRD